MVKQLICYTKLFWNGDIAYKFQGNSCNIKNENTLGDVKKMGM